MNDCSTKTSLQQCSSALFKGARRKSWESSSRSTRQSIPQQSKVLRVVVSWSELGRDDQQLMGLTTAGPLWLIGASCEYLRFVDGASATSRRRRLYISLWRQLITDTPDNHHRQSSGNLVVRRASGDQKQRQRCHQTIRRKSSLLLLGRTGVLGGIFIGV